MKLKIMLEPSDEGGYTAIVPSLPGCISEGNTREETLRNIKEAITLYLEPVEDDFLFTDGWLENKFKGTLLLLPRLTIKNGMEIAPGPRARAPLNAYKTKQR